MSIRKRGRSGGPRGAAQRSGPGFCTWFVHHLTGKKMMAADYGLKAWPIGFKNKKR